MPAALVAKLAESTDIDIAEAEKRWNQAKAITTEEKGLTDKDGDAFWQYVTGVFKRSMGIGAVMEAADPRPLVERSRVRECPTSYGTCPTCGSSNVYGTRGMTSDRGCSDCHACWHYLDGEQVMGQTRDLYRVFWKDAEGRAWVFESATAEEIHVAAHEAATSHLNDLPQPTQAQVEAGNYKKGKIRLHGLEITIENPKDSTRSGVDPDGKPWEVTMPYHYGYFNRTLAVDGDHIDCLIGDHPESELVFFVDQVDAATQKYDEPKVVLATRNLKEARDLYVSGFSDGKGGKRLGAMTAMHMPDFKEWLKEGDTTKPLSDAVLESAVAKEPWEMTRSELAGHVSVWKEKNGRVSMNFDGKPFGSPSLQARAKTQDTEALFVGAHEESVRLALEAGKIVPKEVMAEYPLLTSAPSYVTAIQSADSFDGIRGAFAAKWPEVFGASSPDSAINRLTNNVDGAIGQVSNTTEGDTMIEKNEKDGFAEANRDTAYYIEQLKALGCPEELLQVARDLTAKKKPINENNASEDGVQQETVKWDGSEFYYLSKGEWGFNRIQIMPSNGYVDFGQGFATPPEKVTPPPVVPKNPKTGPQRVAVLRSMAADIPGMQDYLDKMDAVTTKKEMRQLDDQKYLLIPSLRDSEIKIGELSLYWIMADLRDQKEREINKRLKEEAQAAKTTKEREKTEKKEREDLQLNRYKERPELKKVLDLISADFRVEIVEGVTRRYTRMVEQYFTAERPRTLNLLRPDPRKTSEWEWASYQRTMGDLKPFMVQTSAEEPPVLRSTWKAILDKLANDTADYWIAQFENKTAWKLGDVLEKKGGGDVSLAGNVHEHAIRMAFPDGSGFTMRTQQVYSVSSKGTPFARYPTTFHEVVFANGDRMSIPSAAKMQKEFGIADDKDAATGE